MNQPQFPGQFPGQPQQPPQAPVPQAGGFPPPPAGYQQPPAAGYQQPPQPAYQQPPPAGYQQPPQPAYQQPVAVHPSQQVPATALPPLPQHLQESLKNAQMGGGHAKMLPDGDYVTVVDSHELTAIGPEGGRKQWVLFVTVAVEQSSNPSTPAGFKGKITRFLESDFNTASALGKVLELVGMCLGYNSTEELSAAMPDWVQQLQSNPSLLRGARLAASVRPAYDKKTGQRKVNKDGSPKSYDDYQRITA